MKRSLPSIIAGAGLVIILGLYMITYQVRLNQVAVVRTFGKITEPDPETGASPDVKTEPRLYPKWPWPIQRVIVLDNRLQTTETTGEETPTRDAKNIIVTTAIGWRIDDPYTFSIRNRDMADAEEKLKSRVRNDQKTVIANYDFTNFVSTDDDELQYDQIEESIQAAVAQSARELYGIRVEYIGIEKLALPKQITENVFSAMREERNAQAARDTSAGEAEAERIRADAENIAGTILAFAQRKADEIEAEGKLRAAQYNETFAKDEGLAIFLWKIDVLKKILMERATLVLDAKPPFDLLGESAAGGGSETATTRPAAPAGTGKATEIALPEIVRPK